MKEINISKNLLRNFLKCFILSFILFTITIPFSEFDYKKYKLKSVAEKEAREYKSNYNSQKMIFDECLNWCKNNPPPQERVNPNFLRNHNISEPIYITDEESVRNSLKRLACGCPKEDYIGTILKNKRFSFVSSSTTTTFYSYNDFYIGSIEIKPLFGNSYNLIFKNQNLSWRDYIYKSKKWSWDKRLKLCVFGVMCNLHFIILFGVLFLLFFYLLRYLRYNIKIKLK